MFQISNLTKKYGDHVILKNLNLEINPGEVVGIVGVDGAGKSTLFKVVTGLEQVESGEILLENQPIQDLEPYSRAELGLAKTFQWDSLFDNLTVFENLAFTLKIPKDANVAAQLLHFLRVGNQTKRDFKITEVLENVGLLNSINTPLKELTPKDMHKVELAKVLLQDWKILLLDESLSTSMVDQRVDLIEQIQTIKDPRRKQRGIRYSNRTVCFRI